MINSGASSTNIPNVTLTLSAVDSDTGVAEMRFSNDNVAWTAWETYNTTRSWTLPAPDGTKTVYVQFRNNAGQASVSYSDSIILSTDITPPSPNPMTWATEPYDISTSSIAMVATTATDLNGPPSGLVP